MSHETAYGELLRTLLLPGLQEPAAFEVKETRAETSVSLLFTVHPDDRGRVIGRHGSGLGALRSLLDFAARQRGDRLSLLLAED